MSRIQSGVDLVKGRQSRSRRSETVYTWFASCPPGVEGVLHAEAREAGLGGLESQVGGVQFRGGEWDGFRAALHLRTAVRVYRQLARFSAPTADELYQGAAAVDWGA